MLWRILDFEHLTHVSNLADRLHDSPWSQISLTHRWVSRVTLLPFDYCIHSSLTECNYTFIVSPNEKKRILLTGLVMLL